MERDPRSLFPFFNPIIGCMYVFRSRLNYALERKFVGGMVAIFGMDIRCSSWSRTVFRAANDSLDMHAYQIDVSGPRCGEPKH